MAGIVDPNAGTALTFDAVETESRNNPVSVPELPVRGEGVVTDNAQSELSTVSIRAVVSEIPSPTDARGTGEGESRIDAADSYLRSIEERVLSYASVDLGVLQPVLLSDWSTRRRGPVERIEVSAELVEARFAEPSTVDLPPEKVAETTLAGNADAGRQSTDERPLPADRLRRDADRFLGRSDRRSDADVAAAQTGRVPTGGG